VFSEHLPPQTVHEWWQRWLAASNGKPVAVPDAVGKTALTAWLERFHAVWRRGA